MSGVVLFCISEVSTFWTTFWASLCSGIIYSLITGLIVGFIIWKVQVISDTRRLHADIEREIAVLILEIRLIINKPDGVIINYAIKTVPDAATALFELLATKPIELWLDKIPEQNKFLKLLIGFQANYTNFITNAQNLDSRLRHFIRNYNASKDIYAINDHADISFFIGRIIGFDSYQIMPWIDLPPSEIVRLEKSFHAATEDLTVSIYIQPFLDSRQLLVEVISKIRKKLNNKKSYHGNTSTSCN